MIRHSLTPTAVAFGFFELLLRCADPNLIGMEHARFSSLNNLMESVGFQSYIFEDFAQATLDLFNSFIGAPSDYDLLIDTFNNPAISDAIVTHFKVGRRSGP